MFICDCASGGIKTVWNLVNLRNNYEYSPNVLISQCETPFKNLIYNFKLIHGYVKIRHNTCFSCYNFIDINLKVGFHLYLRRRNCQRVIK